MTPAARVAALTLPRNARLLDCTGEPAFRMEISDLKDVNNESLEKRRIFYHRRGELRKKNWEHGLGISPIRVPNEVTVFCLWPYQHLAPVQEPWLSAEAEVSQP